MYVIIDLILTQCGAWCELQLYERLEEWVIGINQMGDMG
jgi:hypothetical protein